jgi:hypothetical protein
MQTDPLLPVDDEPQRLATTLLPIPLAAILAMLLLLLG